MLVVAGNLPLTSLAASSLVAYVIGYGIFAALRYLPVFIECATFMRKVLAAAIMT